MLEARVLYAAALAAVGGGGFFVVRSCWGLMDSLRLAVYWREKRGDLFDLDGDL